jgi:hypothetical protein
VGRKQLLYSIGRCIKLYIQLTGKKNIITQKLKFMIYVQEYTDKTCGNRKTDAAPVIVLALRKP